MFFFLLTSYYHERLVFMFLHFLVSLEYLCSQIYRTLSSKKSGLFTETMILSKFIQGLVPVLITLKV